MRCTGSRQKGRGNSMKKYYKNHGLGWFGSFLILFGYYLNAEMNPDSWLVWIIGNTCIGIYCLGKEAYPMAVMSFILVILNIYGYVSWTTEFLF